MTHIMVLLAATTLGVEAGWQPLPEGGHEYTIQIEPSLVSLLQSGNDVVSEVPSQVDVRRFRIKLGTGKLSRVDGPPPAQVAETPAPTPAQPADSLPKDTTAPRWPNETNAAPTFGSTERASPAPTESLTLPLTDLPPPPTDTAAADPRSAAPSEPAIPANFEEPPANAQPLADTSNASATTTPATSPPAADASNHDTQKPSLPPASGADKPWLPLLLVIVFLACSLGANLYLGWIAFDARHRYRDALARVRTA